MFHLKIRIFQDVYQEILKSMDGSGHADALRLEVDRLKWQHEMELNEMKHNHELTVAEIRQSVENEKKNALDELRKKLEKEKETAICKYLLFFIELEIVCLSNKKISIF